MPTQSEQIFRQLLSQSLDWQNAHVNFETTIKEVPPAKRGLRLPGAPYSPWELLEHLRLAQRDILDYCQAEPYQSHAWPDDYWPESPEPPSEEAWDKSIDAFLKDTKEAQTLINHPEMDLFATVPHHEQATYFKEMLIILDHNAYHVGQLVLLCRMMGEWD